MPLHRRLPKRGFSNLFRVEYRVINVERLNRFPAGSVVDPQALAASGVLAKGRDPIKVLGHGELSVALTVRAHGFTGAAQRKIEAAGGRAERIAARDGA
jgi:large subunit ribosomal protein L15